MPKNQIGLASLVIGALDEFENLRSQQQVLEVIIDLFHNPDENLATRAGLLLDMYRSAVDNQLDELRVSLEGIHKLVVGSKLEGGS